MSLNSIANAPLSRLRGAGLNDADEGNNPFDRALKRTQNRLDQLAKQMQQVRESDLRADQKKSRLASLDAESIMLRRQSEPLIQARLQTSQG